MSICHTFLYKLLSPSQESCKVEFQFFWILKNLLISHIDKTQNHTVLHVLFHQSKHFLVLGLCAWYFFHVKRKVHWKFKLIIDIFSVRIKMEEMMRNLWDFYICRIRSKWWVFGFIWFRKRQWIWECLDGWIFS